MCIRDSYYSHYHFVDPTALLKGSDNKLMEKYAFEDGTHLEMSGMRAVSYTHLDVYKRQGI